MREVSSVAKVNEAIGGMTRQFAVLELLLHMLVWELVGGSLGAAVATRGMSFGQLVELADDLVKEGVPGDEGRRQRIQQFVPRLKEVGRERNGLIHALTGMSEGEVTVTGIRDILRGVGVSKRVKVSQVEELNSRCKALTIDVATLIDEIEQEPLSLPTLGDVREEAK